MAQNDDHLGLIGQLLEAFLAGLRHPTDSDTALAWLADDIEQTLGEHEAAARRAWSEKHDPGEPIPPAILSDAERIEIALETCYGQLADLPAMWAHVQRAWQARGIRAVALVPHDGAEREFTMTIEQAEALRTDALRSLEALAHALTDWYPDSFFRFDWRHEARLADDA